MKCAVVLLLCFVAAQAAPCSPEEFQAINKALQNMYKDIEDNFAKFLRDIEPPADDEAPPEADPADDEKPPADEPADDKKPPAEEPADDKKPPADEPADDKKPPADDKKPPADDKKPPADDKPAAPREGFFSKLFKDGIKEAKRFANAWSGQ